MDGHALVIDTSKRRAGMCEGFVNILPQTDHCGLKIEGVTAGNKCMDVGGISSYGKKCTMDALQVQVVKK